MVIGVIGMGRFGTLWAGLLAKHGFYVIVSSRRVLTDLPDGVVQKEFEQVCRADYLFLCNAISALGEVFKSLARCVGSDTYILDTCSVKMWPEYVYRSCFGERNVFLGTHPMFGPDSAKDGVEGLPICLAPLDENCEHFRFWDKTFNEWGLDVRVMSSRDHDKEAAFTQGITHFLGRTLDALDLKTSSIATSGYNSLLEIMKQTCNDSWQLFCDLQHYNPYTRQMRAAFASEVGGMLDMMEDLGQKGDGEWQKFMQTALTKEN